MTTVEEARAEFEEAFHACLAAKKEWDRRTFTAHRFQERAFSAKIEYYEAARVLDEKRLAWDKAEKAAKKGTST